MADLTIQSGPFKGKPQQWFTRAEVERLLTVEREHCARLAENFPYGHVSAAQMRAAADGVQAPDEWAEVERVRDLPEVDEALLNFKDDCTGDNAAMVVRAVMRAALGVSPCDRQPK